ncbi:DUF3052 domain-containing protein [uncultured Winogradskyella sp.]|uniref:DUF3052 domain-containing protein n=1 Tax=uncultured Winogradskyella sp. TaxID=395353 RepID=UPI00260398C7|nr:DUF3052 domain-containing protein [uncultured Winogradskyella sp.]
MKNAGYSKTPLAKKLGIKEGYVIMLVNEPVHYMSLFEEFPNDTIRKKELDSESFDFIHIFVQNQAELERIVSIVKPAMKKNGILWISWPKGASKIPTELKREPVREHLLKTRLVDIKVCAIDKD